MSGEDLDRGRSHIKVAVHTKFSYLPLYQILLFEASAQHQRHFVLTNPLLHGRVYHLSLHGEFQLQNSSSKLPIGFPNLVQQYSRS
jgi:hypothetical protein